MSAGAAASRTLPSLRNGFNGVTKAVNGITINGTSSSSSGGGGLGLVAQIKKAARAGFDLFRSPAKFYNYSVEERQAIVREHCPGVTLRDAALSMAEANSMIENVIGVHTLPMGLALNFRINGKDLAIPMVVEEASVIAAASNAAKMVKEGGGGFKVEVTPNVIQGHVHILDVEDSAAASKIIMEKTDYILQYANQFCEGMCKRGGGIQRIECHELSDTSMAVHFYMDAQDAMGANAINTCLEGAGPLLADLTGGRKGMCILSNLSPEHRAKASFRMNPAPLESNGYTGREVAKRLVEAYEFACQSPYRAVTHNKGIMNGIDAVALATGQDWRAIEANAHAWVTMRDGRYSSMSKFEYDEEEDIFSGELDIPLQVGARGGSTNHPTVQDTFAILGNPNTEQLAGIIVCAGLASNIAACRALTTVGIQKGHMKLHARSREI